jgi:hypothetical protein
MLSANDCSTKVLDGQGAETAVMVFPCQVLDPWHATRVGGYLVMSFTFILFD